LANVAARADGYIRTYSEMCHALDCVYLYKTLYDHNLQYLYPENGVAPQYVGEDDGYLLDTVYEAIFRLSDAVWPHYSEYHETHTIYFSHPALMEYYHLCRVYGRQRGIPLHDNPYMRSAKEFVRSRLGQDCFTCSYRLQTKINHQWSAGIVFVMWPEFTGHLALLVLMGQVFDFYKRELQQLKADIVENEGQLPQQQWKEAA
jgi:hypothetical protein